MKKKSESSHWSLDHKKNAPSIGAKSQPLSEHLDGQSPTIFVGRYGYPKVNVGFLSVDQYTDQNEYDTWVKKGYTISSIAKLRSSLLHATFQQDIKATSRLAQMSQEIAMAKKVADMQIDLAQQPRPTGQIDNFAAPFGPSASLKKAEITSHIKVPRAIDKAVGDTDVKATTALQELYKKHVDVHKMTGLLSVGTLGVKRKMVPTRWSITAVDDTLGKNILTDIRLHDTAPTHVFFGNYLGNYFLVLFLEGSFSYELFEMYVHGTNFTTDYEDFDGRKGYVKQTAGGYYAARLPIVEYLQKEKKQAKVLVIRIITEEYTTPLGVWVVRQAVRNAMASTPIHFDSQDLAILYAKKLAQKKFNYSLDAVLHASITLNKKMNQARLVEYR